MTGSSGSLVGSNSAIAKKTNNITRTPTPVSNNVRRKTKIVWKSIEGKWVKIQYFWVTFKILHTENHEDIFSLIVNYQYFSIDILIRIKMF